MPKNALIEKRYRAELALSKSKLKTAKAELKKHLDSLKTLQDEVINAIQGTSKFDSGLLNELIGQTKEKAAIAEKEVKAHELDLENKNQHMADIQTQYDNLISWADIFQDSNKETKKMITAYLIESVKVSRGYEVEIKFHIAYKQFCNAG